MRSHLLLPHRFQHIGWSILIPALLLSFLVNAYGYSIDWLTITVPVHPLTAEYRRFHTDDLNLTDTFSIVSLITGMGFVTFSREAVEDEMIAQIRLKSLQWSLLINYILLIMATLLVYGFSYSSVLVYNLFTPLLIFILRFRWLIYRNNQLMAA
ncbi:hypothetical protein [Fibrella aquatica]|uniref:hypothetical protein n=1 Tax=Fibrella aquatica TaxID=3242487 RepID=UPI0035203B21